MTLAEVRANREFWGRLVESAVGAHLVGGDGLALETFLSMPVEDWLLS